MPLSGTGDEAKAPEAPSLSDAVEDHLHYIAFAVFKTLDRLAENAHLYTPKDE